MSIKCSSSSPLTPYSMGEWNVRFLRGIAEYKFFSSNLTYALLVSRFTAVSSHKMCHRISTRILLNIWQMFFIQPESHLKENVSANLAYCIYHYEAQTHQARATLQYFFSDIYCTSSLSKSKYVISVIPRFPKLTASKKNLSRRRL